MELVASAASTRLILANLDRLGVNPDALGVGTIDPALRRTTAPMQVPAHLSFDLLESAARHLGQPDFGLRHALWLNLRGLDSISLLWEHTLSIEHWFRLASRFIHLEHTGLSYRVSRHRNDVALVHDILAHLRPQATQASFTFLTMTARVCRERLGSAWTPRRIEFMAPRPRDISQFRKYFRCPISFGARRDAVILAQKDFERPLPRHNPELVRFFEHRLKAQSAARAQPAEDTVFAVLMSEMAGGPPGLQQIAARMGMTSRTLQRHLSKAGTTYGQLLARARTDVANALARRKVPSTLAQLAHHLGFSDATAASRFLRLSNFGKEGTGAT
jgi:AraC-like DNA-binding protein